MVADFCYNSGVMLKVINYGHSCFQFIADKISVIFDPYRGVDNLQMPMVNTNYCFCSHHHADHDAVEFIKVFPCQEQIEVEKIIVPHDHHNGEKRGLNTIHIFTLEGYKIAHLGDIGCIPKEEILEKLKGLDIVFAPINGFYTISAEELRQLADLIKPRLVVPMHYYRKENKSGYFDGNQIDIFKRIFDYQEINESSFVVDESIFAKPSLILLSSEGDYHD